MSEGIPRQEKNSPQVSERSVNWDNNDTELVFERAQNPIIAEQLNRLLLQIETEEMRSYKEDEWIPYLPEGWTGEERYKLMINTRTNVITDIEVLAEMRSKPYPTAQDIEKQTGDRISELAAVTDFNYSTDGPSVNNMSLNWKIPWTKEKPNTKQWSIIEAHEKGHGIRQFNKLDTYFRSGFDISAVKVTDEDHDLHKFDYEQGEMEYVNHNTNESIDDFAERYLNEYLFSAIEIAERMSQLKNYFGFSGSEIFTKQHLDYAREHYLEDTGMDNSMRLFFEGITPETESKFLELINNSGI